MYRTPYELAATVQKDREREAQQHRLIKITTAGNQNRSFNPTSVFMLFVRNVAQKSAAAP
jgi:hypothetical protein